MAKQIKGVYERLIACAIEEFLEKGYKDASLRTIAEKAETSTGSIYVRFKDKEGLFSAIVEPVAEELKRRYIVVQETFHSFDEDKQKEEVNKYSLNEMLKMIDYMYDHFNEFYLLLDASYGTRFHNYVNELVEIEEEYTFKWEEVTGFKLKLNTGIDRELYHIVLTSYFEGIFEVIRHKIEREHAKEYIKKLSLYHQSGFWAIAGDK